MTGKSEKLPDQYQSGLKASVFPFLRLPQEIRDKIYRMLLTTPYTYVESANQRYFDGCPPIWLTNKQLAAEASRVLYEENQFVLIQVNQETCTRPPFGDIPLFHRLRPEQVTNPVLRVGIDEHIWGSPQTGEQVVLITTLQGILSIIQALWVFLTRPKSKWYVSLTLQFPNKVPSRLVHHVLDPWEQVSGCDHVTIEGRISENTVASLTKCLQSEPTPSDGTRWLEIHESKMLNARRRKDDQAAQSLWHHLTRHWQYYDRLEQLEMENRRRNDLETLR